MCCTMKPRKGKGREEGKGHQRHKLGFSVRKSEQRNVLVIAQNKNYLITSIFLNPLSQSSSLPYSLLFFFFTFLFFSSLLSFLLFVLWSIQERRGNESQNQQNKRMLCNIVFENSERKYAPLTIAACCVRILLYILYPQRRYCSVIYRLSYPPLSLSLLSPLQHHILMR